MTNQQKSYNSINIKKLEKSIIEIESSIPAEIWAGYKKQALKNINENIEIDGFRKGMIPENILINKIGEMRVWEEMAELALSRAYAEIIIDNKIDAIGKPEIHITKIAKDNPLEFKAITAVIPEVKLPDYKKIAHEKIKEHLKEFEKETKKDKESKMDDEKLRISIVEAIGLASKVDLPELIVKSELNRIEAQFKFDIEQMGVKLEDYIKHANKTLEDIHKEWRPHAENRAKWQLVLNQIAKIENLNPSVEEIEAETNHILEHHKNANREEVIIYAETVLKNSKVLKFLEEIR